MKEPLTSNPCDQLLIDLRTALGDWINTYASEFCDEQYVKTAHERIADGGGTLSYIASLIERVNDTLEGRSAPETPGSCLAPRAAQETASAQAGMSVEPKYITKYCMDHGHWYHWPDTQSPVCQKCPALKAAAPQCVYRSGCRNPRICEEMGCCQQLGTQNGGAQS